VKVDIDGREIEPLRVEMHAAGRRGVLPVVGTALAMAKALPASSLLVGLIKPPLQHLRRWGPAEKGGVERPPHGEAWCMGPTHRSERATER